MSAIQYFHEVITETVWGISVRDILVVSMCILCACVADIIFVRKLPVWLDRISAQVRSRRRKTHHVNVHEQAVHGPDGIEQKPENSGEQSEATEEREDVIAAEGGPERTEEPAETVEESPRPAEESGETSEDEREEKDSADHFERSLSMFEIVATSLRKPLRFVIYLVFFGLSLKLLSRVPGEETPVRDLLGKIVESGLVVCLVWYAIIVTNRLTQQFSQWVFPKSTIATITGIGAMAGGIGSFLINKGSGVLFTYAEGQGSAFTFFGFEGKPAAYMIVFCICAVAYLIGWSIMKALVPKYEPIVVED